MMSAFPSAVMALGLVVMAAMAYAKGANDVAKTVATLVGSGVADYRRAIRFGSVCTAAGACLAVFLGQQVATTLTRGIVAANTPIDPAFALAALAGAAGWVLIATRAAVPVSSSHAIVGSIILLGAFVFGPGHVLWDSVWLRVVLPMMVSPLVAIPVGLALHGLLRPIARHRSLAAGHWLSAGAASFARGVNDAPKMVALGAFFFMTAGPERSFAPVVTLYGLVAAGMTLGSLVAGRRVTETLAEKVTPLNDAEGLAVNMTTASIALMASHYGLPVSITHVISSSLVGIGARRAFREVCWSVVLRMAVAWFVTLPMAGLLATAAYLLVRT